MSLHVELGKEEWQYIRRILKAERMPTDGKHTSSIIRKIDDVIGKES